MNRLKSVRLALIAAGVVLAERLGDETAQALRDGLLDGVIKALTG